MAQCASVRKKGSKDRCEANTVLNSDFCGRHARMKVPVRWADTQDESYIRTVVHLQSRIRGFLVRRSLRWAGPGVLSRKHCINDEEMVTFESKSEVHPFEYFGWEENGKIWWMSQLSALQLLREELRPVNPYTKVPWSLDIRKRLRRLQCHRLRSKRPLWHSQPPKGTMTQIYVRSICQTLEEQACDELHPNHWNAMSNYQQIVFLEVLSRMLDGWAMETPVRPWRVQYATYARKVYNEIRFQPTVARWAVSRLVTVLLNQDRSVPDVAFLITSARFQSLTR